MTHKKQIFTYGIPAGVILLLGLLFTTIPSFLRGDLLSVEPLGPSGLYLPNTQNSTSLVSSGALLQLGTHTLEAQLPVELLVTAGDFGSVSGSLSYNPEDISINKSTIKASSGYTMDTFLVQVSRDVQGKEQGRVTFSFDKRAEHAEAREETVATFFFTQRESSNPKTKIWIDNVSFSSNTKEKELRLSLHKKTPLATQISKALTVSAPGFARTNSYEKSGSGIVMEKIISAQSGSLLRTLEWVESSPYNGLSEHVLSEIQNQKGNVISSKHYIFSPYSTKLTEHKEDGSIISNSYDHLGRIIAQEKHTPNEQRIYQYSYGNQNKVTKTEYVVQNGIESSTITYPDESTHHTEELPGGSATSTYRMKDSTVTFTWDIQDQKITSTIVQNSDLLEKKSYPKNVKHCFSYIPEGSVLTDFLIDVLPGKDREEEHVRNLCSIYIKSPKEGFSLSSFFFPVVLKIPTENIQAPLLFYNQSTKLWEPVEERWVLSRSDGYIKFAVLRTGTYALATTSSH